MYIFLEQCEDDTCNGNGVCEDDSGVAICICEEGFGGPYCDYREFFKKKLIRLCFSNF